MPELARIVEEVAATQQPRELKRDNKTVAILSPATAKNTAKWETIRATFGSWSDLDADELIAEVGSHIALPGVKRPMDHLKRKRLAAVGWSDSE